MEFGLQGTESIAKMLFILAVSPSLFLSQLLTAFIIL